MLQNRYLHQFVEEDLKLKMVFISGPRQVGKTTFAKSLLANDQTSCEQAYLNWDYPKDRKEILKQNLPTGAPIIILDEIHKYPKWKSLIKGFYDKHKETTKYLVTGSARLDVYRKGGDSLQGRYHHYHLHPLTLPEVNDYSHSSLEQLLTLGGFPEPFFSGKESQARRWRNEYADRLIREDIRDMQNIRDLSLLELLVDSLPAKVGSPLSIQSLREDLEVAHPTVARWLDILEKFYFSYRISPYGAPKIRAVKKEQKLYLWDWSRLENQGARFENFVASHLFKYCHYVQETTGHKMELRYVRDIDGRELDFIVLKDKKPIFAVEAKKSQSQIEPSLRYFQKRLKIPNFYQVHMGKEDYFNDGIRVLPFANLCRELNLV